MENTEPRILVELKITMNEKGQVAIMGPIEQTMLCYGLLEIGKDLVRQQKEHKTPVVQPSNNEKEWFGRKAK